MLRGAGCLTFGLPLTTLIYPIHQVVLIWIGKEKRTIAVRALHPTTAERHTFSGAEDHFEFFRVCTFDVNIKREFLRKIIVAPENHWTCSAIRDRKAHVGNTE